MPIRLMVWNIQAFGQNKMGTTAFDINGSRANYITSSIAEVNPHILIVIEVRTGQQNGVGSLITDTSGGPGVRTLWPLLPGGAIPGGPWAVVPPLLINPNINANGGNVYSEGTAVFFRTDLLDFTGPYKWTGAGALQGAQEITNPALPNATGAAAAAYGAPWAGCLPAAAPWNNLPALNQDQLAGQPIFWDNAAPRQQIFFPTVFDRNPWCTTFIENTGAAGNRRTIKIWSVHLPPRAADSRTATARLADIPEVTAGLGANEVRVLCGDFNVNTMDPAQNNIFDQLTANTARVMASATSNLYTTHFQERTALMPVRQASPRPVGGTPYYGYTQIYAGRSQGLDNILTAYGGAAGGAANSAVVNRVVGTPPQDVMPAMPAVFTVALGTSIPNILATGFPAPTMDRLFRQLNNFGKIGGQKGASDHMALVIDL